MIWKQVTERRWIDMEKIISVEFKERELTMIDTTGVGLWRFPLDELKDTPEQWRNWLRERS